MIDKEKKEENIKFLLEEKYNKIKYKISNLEMKKNFLLNDGYDTSITPNYSGLPSGKGGTSDKVYNAVSKKDDELEKINSEISNYKSFINMMDDLIGTLNYKQQAIVKRRAFQHKDFITIAKELKRDEDIDIYDAKYCRELYSKSCKSLQQLIEN